VTSGLAFEPFVRDFATGRYSTALVLDDRRVPITVAGVGDEDPDGAEAVAADAIRWAAQHLAEIATFTAEQLLDDYNAGWVDDPADQVTAAQFIARLSIRRVDADSDGTMRVELADRGMFRGHDVIVSVNPHRAIIDVELAG
jgi:hypothetical protein